MNVPSVISSELHFQLQAVLCSVTISFDVKMNDTSSKCRVSSAEGKDKSVFSHQEDWLRVIFMRWLSEEAKYKRVILRSVFFSDSLLWDSARGGQFQSDRTKILVGIAPWRSVHVADNA